MLIASIVPSSATPSVTTRSPGSRMPLAVERVHADRFRAQDFSERAVLAQRHVVAIGEHDLRVGVDLAALQPQHPVVHAPGQLADLGMQAAAEGDVHLLHAAAKTENRQGFLDAGSGQGKRQRIAALVIGLVGGVGLGSKMAGMDIGARTGQQESRRPPAAGHRYR